MTVIGDEAGLLSNRICEAFTRMYEGKTETWGGVRVTVFTLRVLMQKPPRTKSLPGWFSKTSLIRNCPRQGGE